MTTAERPNGRTWVRFKLTFVDRVMDDRGVPPVPFKLAAALARYADAETGIVDRSQAFLAEVVNVKLRALQLAIDLLVKRGHVVVLKPKGRRSGNRYAPVLCSKDDPEPVHMHEDAYEADPVHMHDDAHEADVHAQLNARSYAPPCAPSPVYSPVIDHPVTDAPASPPQTTTTGVAEDGLLDQVRRAIEAAGGKLARRPHNLQPIRDLIAGGVAVDVALAVVADRASKLRGPLGNLDAQWLLDAIRDRAAAYGYGTDVTELSLATAPEAVPVGSVRLEGGAVRTLAFVEAAVSRWRDGFAWPPDLGFPPDSEFTSVPENIRGPRH